jgi:hypothetical protein
VRALLVDSEGYLWIAAGRRPADLVATWSVFDPDGEWLGDIPLAAGLEPLEIGADYLLVRLKDELDVESVHLIDLRRRR